jgi:glycosyltransferase involved in cell wall biosynthesis
MKFSIIVPTFNRSRHLEKLINSVLLQTYKIWELIIIDDRSTDDTLITLKKYEQNTQIFFMKRSSDIKGACSCRNEGLAFASGDYVIFLDSDDELYDYCLQKRFELLCYEKYDFVVNSGVLSKFNGNTKYLWNVPSLMGDLVRFVKLDSPWSTTGPTFQRSWLLNEGILWDNNLKIWQDVDFHLQVLLRSKNYFVDWFSEPDYLVWINEVDSTSRVDYYNIQKIESQYYLLKKYHSLFNNQLDVMYYNVFHSLVKTRQYCIVYNLLFDFNLYNSKKMLKYYFWGSAVLNHLTFNRINLDKLISRYYQSSTIGKFEFNNA